MRYCRIIVAKRSASDGCDAWIGVPSMAVMMSPTCRPERRTFGEHARHAHAGLTREAQLLRELAGQDLHGHRHPRLSRFEAWILEHRAADLDDGQQPFAPALERDERCAPAPSAPRSAARSAATSASHVGDRRSRQTTRSRRLRRATASRRLPGRRAGRRSRARRCDPPAAAPWPTTSSGSTP